MYLTLITHIYRVRLCRRLSFSGNKPGELSEGISPVIGGLPVFGTRIHKSR